MINVNEYLDQQKEICNGIYQEITKEIIIEEFNKIIDAI